MNDPKLFLGGASVFQKKMLCDMINVMNGSGSLSNDNRRMLGKVFWAPGLVDSQLKRLIGYQIWHPWTASAAELLLSFAPISLRDAGKSIYENSIEDREWGTAFLGAGLTMFGIGKGAYRKDDYKILTNRFLESKKEYDAIDNDDLIDDQNKRLMLDSIVAENPLMRDEVREDIAADIAQVRKYEARARKDEEEDYEADTALLSDIEHGKAAILEKIRRSRR